MGAAFLLAGAVGGSFFPDLPWIGIIVGLVGMWVFTVIFVGDGKPHLIMWLVYWASASMYLPPYRQAFLMSALAGWGYMLLTAQTGGYLLDEGFSLFGSSKRMPVPVIIANPALFVLYGKEENPEKLNKIVRPVNIVVSIGCCLYILEIIAWAVR